MSDVDRGGKGHCIFNNLALLSLRPNAARLWAENSIKGLAVLNSVGHRYTIVLNACLRKTVRSGAHNKYVFEIIDFFILPTPCPRLNTPLNLIELCRFQILRQR